MKNPSPQTLFAYLLGNLSSAISTALERFTYSDMFGLNTAEQKTSFRLKQYPAFTGQIVVRNAGANQIQITVLLLGNQHIGCINSNNFTNDDVVMFVMQMLYSNQNLYMKGNLL